MSTRSRKRSRGLVDTGAGGSRDWSDMPPELLQLCAIETPIKKIPALPALNTTLVLTMLMNSEAAKVMRQVCRSWRHAIDTGIQRLLVKMNNDPKQPPSAASSTTTRQASDRHGRLASKALQLDVNRFVGLRSIDVHQAHQITLTSSSTSLSPQALQLPNISILAIDLARPHSAIMPLACPNTVRLSATCNGFAPQGAVARHIGMGLAGVGLGGGGAMLGLGDHAGGGGGGGGGGGADLAIGGGGGLAVHFAGDARTPSPSLSQVSIQRNCSKVLLKACASLPLLRELGLVALDISQSSLWEEMSDHCPRIEEIRLYGCSSPSALSRLLPSPPVTPGPNSPSLPTSPQFGPRTDHQPCNNRLGETRGRGTGSGAVGEFSSAFANLKKLTMRSCHPVSGASRAKAMALAAQLAAQPGPNPGPPPNPAPPPPLVPPLLPPLAEAFAALHAAMHGMPPEGLPGLPGLAVLGEIGAGGEGVIGGGGAGGNQPVPLNPDAALWRSFFRSLPLHAPNLEKLDISQNGLEHLPIEGFGTLHRLETLDLSANRLIDIPSVMMAGLESLKSLDLSHNHVEVVPESLSTLSTLTSLNLSRNWLNAWSLVRLAPLTRLKTLDISYVFSMTSFPLELCGLTDLSSLSLKCTYVHTFPPEFSHLASLTHLDLSFNSQVELGQVAQVLKPPCRTNLVSLHLNHLDLTQFPAEVLALSGLTSLECARNRFTSIPPGFSSLIKLQTLNLQGAYAHKSGSDLSKNLAPSLYQLTDLRVLNLGCNFMGNMPPGISHLSKLETLSLCMNSLLRLPAGVEKLSSLVRLDFRHNQIRVPPSCLLLIPKLNKVAMHGNPMKADAIKKLTKELEGRPGSRKCLIIG